MDDMSAVFSEGQQDYKRRQAIAEMERRMQARRVKSLPAQGDGTAAAPSIPAEVLNAAPEEAQKEERGFLDTAGDAVRDVAKGLTVELPRSLTRGVISGLNEMNQSIADVGNWMREHGIGPNGRLVFGGPDGLVSWQEGALPREEVPQLPNLEEPESTTGRVISDFSQFMTGFALTGRLKPFQALAGAGRAGTVAAGMTRGALTDFSFMDEAGKRLSDVLQQYPALQNPVTEFLASSPEDTAMESRMKNALEGIGLGMAVDGVMHGLKAMRGWSAVKREAGSAERARAAGEEFAAEKEAMDKQYRAFSEKMGDPDGPLFSSGEADRTAVGTGEADKLTSASEAVNEAMNPTGPGIGSSEVGEGMFVNWARIESAEDVKFIMQGMADKFKGRMDEARRGVMTFREIGDAAQTEDAWKLLMERRQGQPLNAEQSLAARNLWTASADKLAQLAKAVQADPSDINMVALRKQLVVHAAIQNEVIAARTETARALASWRIPSRSEVPDLEAFNRILMQNGGREVNQDMAGRMVRLLHAGQIRELDRFVEKCAYAKTRDALLQAWMAALLSNPKTHIVNTASNFLVLGQQLVERRAAAALSQSAGSGEVQAGEGLAMLHGIAAGWRDALSYAYKTLRTGETGFSSGKVELPRESAISAEAFGLSMNTMLGRAAGALADFAGSVTGVPGRMLSTADEFFKTIGSRMELHALAHRMAVEEVRSGKIAAEDIKRRYADIVADPPARLVKAGRSFAEYCTFTNDPGAFANTLSHLANTYAPVRILLPFVRTPANILQYTMERSPLAPMMSRWRADIAAGGARRDVALSRMALGSFTLFSFADMAMSGVITGAGPKDKSRKAALRRTGWQPYSIRIGDRFYAYNRLDPLGATLGYGADLGELLTQASEDFSETQIDELIKGGVFSMASNMTSKTYLSGLSSFFEMMGDPDRYGNSWLNNFARSLVPAGVAQITRTVDPTMREAQTMLDNVRARTPGLSDALPASRDLWGRPVSYRSGLGWAYDAFSPVASSEYAAEPIDKEILRLGVSVNKPGRRISVDGVDIDLSRYPGAYSRYVELAGNGAKDAAYGLGAMEFLNAVVSGQHPMSQLYRMYGEGNEGGKAEFIQDTLRKYRELARKQLLREFPKMAVDVETRRRPAGVGRFISYQ